MQADINFDRIKRFYGYAGRNKDADDDGGEEENDDHFSMCTMIILFHIYRF